MGRARRTGDAGLDVRLLGPLEVLRGGSAVPLGGPKPRALLAVLALEPGRVVSVDRLVDSLWPGDSPESAPHAVQVYVSQLRKGLGAETLATRAPGYVLELDPESVDVHRFVRLADEGRAAQQTDDFVRAQDALREALALWRGPALADFQYEPFAQTEIARLEELRTAALEERIEADLALGRHAELVTELEALVQAQPLRERPRRQLMLALYRSGRQADALGAYRAAREMLLEELGIDPGPELKALETAILRQDESLLPETTVPAGPAMQFRRLVTILFVDVVESMALAEALDAEALGKVLQRYFETVSAVLTRHGGTVEKFAGDAVMAAFGIPVSHEDDALRAARAALEIRLGIAALTEQLVHDHGVGLEVRIGLEAGEVVATPTDARRRLVAGEAVGIAARLEQGAGPGEIVVGELAGRLIDHAAELESLGALEISGRREPVRAYRLVDIAAVGPTFERRVDAALVGRKRELSSLRRSLKRAIDRSGVQVAVVVGSPGVGKSRLAAELGCRAKGVTTLSGRCLSYGEGITYWPVREVLERAAESEERDAVLAALDGETSPPAAEIAWAFRQFCEVAARKQPLLLLFDDLHWAEPTFLELIEHLADRGKGAVLVVCLAREELLEDRPSFLAGRANVERMALDPLSADETEALFERLGGAILETDQRDRVVEAADGNPFFLEQLLALALEGGLGKSALPETVQALLAARLDRLGPGERAVLERGAVVGKDFAADDVRSLLEPDAAPTAGAHLGTLSARGFVRAGHKEAFSFRHALVQEAVYRAAPKRLRAELHERFADRLARDAADLAELDEFVGYHLEQAHRLRSELGESDRRTERLAEDAGRRLGAAGVRAFRRADMHATTSLLGRATSLLPARDPLRRAYLCELGLTRHASRDPDGAAEALAEAVAEAREAGDRRIAAWAHIELEYLKLQREPQRTADDLLDAVAEGIPIFESVDDHRSLGRAWVIAGFVHGGHRGDHRAWEDAAERALEHYRKAAWPTTTCVGEIAAALYYGPTPVQDGVNRCEQLRAETSDRAGDAYLLAFLGGLVAQLSEFERARELLWLARTTLEDLGLRAAASTYCAPVLGDIELLAGDSRAAEQVLRALCDDLERSGALGHLASRASDLAEALVLQGRLDEAAEWTQLAESHAAEDDLDAQIMWRATRAVIHAHRKSFETAEELAREAVRLSASTDDLNRRAKTERDLGDVLVLAGKAAAATSAFERAIHFYEQKGNLAGAGRVRSVHQRLALV